jgi:hypothetical protein
VAENGPDERQETTRSLQGEGARVSIRHSAPAVVSAAVGLSCPVGMTVVTAITDADALPTMALVLAILSFLVQIVV